jgi:hypothetical protein
MTQRNTDPGNPQQNTFSRLRNDPAAAAAFFDEMTDLLTPWATPFRMAKPTETAPRVASVSPIDVSQLFPLASKPIQEVPTPSPVSVNTPKAEPARPKVVPKGPVMPPSGGTLIPDRPVATRHQVNVSVNQMAPRVADAVDLPPLPVSETVPESVQAPRVQAPAPVVDASILTVTDMTAAEKRRKVREESLSDILNKDRGEIL